MPWYAVEALDDALGTTTDLLTPFDAGQWLRLALVVFFLGNVGAGGPSAALRGTPAEPVGGPAVAPDELPVGPEAFGEFDLPVSPEEALPAVAALAVVGLVVGLLYTLVGAVMEFVFVESLRRRRVRIRDYADQHLERGLRLFAFRVGLGLLVAVPALVLTLAASSFVGGAGPEIALGLFAVFVPLLLVLGLLVVVADAFTVNFVVPVMILGNVGVLAGWRRFWPTLTREWEQYAVYVLVRVGLGLAVGVLVSVVAGVVGAVLFAPLALVGVVALPTVGGPAALLSNPVAVAVAVVVGLGYLLAVVAVLAVVFVPVQTYLRYHALLVLGDASSEFDLIPELRREVREE